MKVKFTASQTSVLWGMVLAYTGAYFCRLNLSAALGSIAQALVLTDAQAGMLQTCFAVVYAAGQLVNGALVDRVSPVRHMLLGMVGFACVNLLMSTATGFGMLMVLCLFNGAFQSMLWTPIVRLMALYFEGKRERSKANIFISLTLVMGHLGAWAISGFMASVFSWRMSFSVPAILAAVLIFVVRYLFRDVRAGAVAREEKQQRKAGGKGQLLSMFASTGFLFILVNCILYGFLRDGIVTWAPKLLSAMGGGIDTTVFTLIIPIINTLGILAGKWLNMRGVSNNRMCIALMLMMSALFCAPLPLSHQVVLTALLMGFTCAGLYGLNPLLTALVPLEYDRVGRIGLAAGLVDSFIYLGSALAGVLGGVISQTLGPNGLYLSWLITAVLAAVCMLLSGGRRPLAALERYSAQEE